MSRVPERLMERFMLCARSDRHRRRVDRARERVAEWLRLVENPYCAYSTGKDSTCVLHLVREQRKDVPAVYFDADACFPESRELLEATENVILFKTDEPMLETLKRHGISGVEDFINKIAMQTLRRGPVKRLIAQYKFDGVALGLRMEESSGRRRNALVRGAIYRYKRDGVWACLPIYDWRYDDVWAFIFGNGLPYSRVYDKMWSLPIEDQRTSYLIGPTKRRWGRFVWLARHYPDLFNQLVEVLPEIRGFV